MYFPIAEAQYSSMAMKFEASNHEYSVSDAPMLSSSDANISANCSLLPKAGYQSIANGDRKTKAENS